VITIDGHAIEYRLERRGISTVLILHGGHMSAQCRFGEETFLDASYSVLITSRPGYGRTAVTAGPSVPEFAVRLAGLCRGTLHYLLRRDPQKYLAGILENLTTLDGEVAVRQLGADVGKVIEFLLCCQSGRGFLIDLRAPTDVTCDVAQPTLILATRNDGAVSFDHAQYLAATLPDPTLVEVHTPIHLLWLGEGSDRTNAAIQSFIRL
jgi:pimeloyl-ACP methyl ester carboxylesterase